MTTRSIRPHTYTVLFKVPGFRRLAATMLLARLGGSMWQLAIVLFVLQRFHSPVLVGLTAFVGMAPGLLVSPLAGALLDGYGRVRLIVTDYVVGVVTAGLLAWLALGGALSSWELLLIVGVSSLTIPFGMTGARTLMSLTVPRELWDLANAIDSATYNVAAVAGPAAAGILAGTLGGPATLLVISGIWGLAALLGIRLVDSAEVTRPGVVAVLKDTWLGLAYVFSNRSLRGLTMTMPVVNAGTGVLYVALPVMVLALPNGGAVQVGVLWSALGLAAVAAGLPAGRASTRGRERRIMIAGLVGSGVGFAIIAVSRSLPLAFAGMLVAGLATGPFDVAMFSLRQRAVDPRWFGRAMTISMSFNALGAPLGSALAGPLVRLSLPIALGAAAGLTLAAAAICRLAIPATRAVP